MEVRVTDAFNASAEVAASAGYPDLRMWTAADTIAYSRQHDIPNTQKGETASAVGPYHLILANNIVAGYLLLTIERMINASLGAGTLSRPGRYPPQLPFLRLARKAKIISQVRLETRARLWLPVGIID
jgi:hypothetical protein